MIRFFTTRLLYPVRGISVSNLKKKNVYTISLYLIITCLTTCCELTCLPLVFLHLCSLHVFVENLIQIFKNWETLLPAVLTVVGSLWPIMMRQGGGITREPANGYKHYTGVSSPYQFNMLICLVMQYLLQFFHLSYLPNFGRIKPLLSRLPSHWAPCTLEWTENTILFFFWNWILSF